MFHFGASLSTDCFKVLAVAGDGVFVPLVGVEGVGVEVVRVVGRAGDGDVSACVDEEGVVVDERLVFVAWLWSFLGVFIFFFEEFQMGTDSLIVLH